ncbi:helix-turn-helix domain-containing protein [Nocardioides sp. LMS-CY]|uniref:DNA-binding IclR family transcriptional regulator n=2 Tax=Nocardioidaceae TaxID=85015 RepID=A0A7W4VX63_9ACTN|nr:DNA-binding IclR family transcriptional regulator [Nocardioides soli]QWF20998.1 helix-turn-helix domain-containing protein [Nocardioides sp. LMS-CY]
MEILWLLAEVDEPKSCAEIATVLDLPKSTAHGILRSMLNHDFVAMNDHSLYSVGLRAFEVGAAYRRSIDAVAAVTPQLETLTQSLGLTSHYAILDGDDAVYLCKQDPPGRGIRLASSIGARLPARLTAVGKACLAWLPESRVVTHVGDTTAADPALLDELMAELEKVRARGYAKDTGIAAAGVHCVAAPVFRGTDEPIGAIGASFLMGSDVDSAEVAEAVMTAARQATVLLSGRR